MRVVVGFALLVGCTVADVSLEDRPCVTNADCLATYLCEPATSTCQLPVDTGPIVRPDAGRDAGRETGVMDADVDADVDASEARDAGEGGEDFDADVDASAEDADIDASDEDADVDADVDAS